MLRMRESARRGLNHANVRQRRLGQRLHDDITGCCSELAVANWLGIEWSRSVNAFHHVADVGEDVDVRCTSRDNGHLILREKDHDYRWFLLATGAPPNMLLQGHICGFDAKVPRWWRNAYGAWFVPEDALTAIAPDGSVPPSAPESGRVSVIYAA